MNTWQSRRIDVKTLKNNNDFTVLFFDTFVRCLVSSKSHLKYQTANLLRMQNGMLHMESSFFLLGSFAENIRMLVSFVCGFFFSLHTFWSRSSKNHFCNIFDKLTCDPIICLRYLYRKHFYSLFNNLWMQSIGLVLAPFRGTHNLRNFSWYFFFIEISIFYELIIFQWKKSYRDQKFCLHSSEKFIFQTLAWRLSGEKSIFLFIAIKTPKLIELLFPWIHGTWILNTYLPMSIF